MIGFAGPSTRTCRSTWVSAGLVVAVAVFPPAEAPAETEGSGAVSSGIRCGEIEGGFDDPDGGVERVPHRFGDGRALLVDRCRSRAGERFWSHRLELSVWDDGERVSSQTLFNGITGASGLRYDISPASTRVRVRYDCGTAKNRREGRRSKWCTRGWQWSSVYDRLVETSPGSDDRESEQYHLRQFETSLARDDYERAAQAVRKIADITGPENADWHMRLNRRFLREVARRSDEVEERRGAEESAATAAAALAVALPGTWEREQFESDGLVALPTFERRGEDEGESWRERGRMILERGEETAEIVERLGASLARSDAHRGLARALLEPAVRAHPERVELRLQFADVLWELGREADAAEAYREVFEAAGEDEADALPDRVRERREAP